MVRQALLEWQVRDSLLAYMQRSPDFAVRADGGAEFTGTAVRVPALVQEDGAVEATGWIELSAHGGALCLALVGAVLRDGALWVDDPLGEHEKRRLVHTDPAGAGYDTRLAADADVLFLYSYVPGAPFGSLRVLEG